MLHYCHFFVVQHSIPDIHANLSAALKTQVALAAWGSHRHPICLSQCCPPALILRTSLLIPLFCSIAALNYHNQLRWDTGFCSSSYSFYLFIFELAILHPTIIIFFFFKLGKNSHTHSHILDIPTPTGLVRDWSLIIQVGREIPYHWGLAFFILLLEPLTWTSFFFSHYLTNF